METSKSVQLNDVQNIYVASILNIVTFNNYPGHDVTYLISIIHIRLTRLFPCPMGPNSSEV